MMANVGSNIPWYHIRKEFLRKRGNTNLSLTTDTRTVLSTPWKILLKYNSFSEVEMIQTTHLSSCTYCHWQQNQPTQSEVAFRSSQQMYPSGSNLFRNVSLSKDYMFHLHIGYSRKYFTNVSLTTLLRNELGNSYLEQKEWYVNIHGTLILKTSLLTQYIVQLIKLLCLFKYKNNTENWYVVFNRTNLTCQNTVNYVMRF
jgi:hypothetical protein